MGAKSHWRGRRRRFRLVALACVGTVLVAFVLYLALTNGFERLHRFLTVPSLEANSGNKFTPGGAVKRVFEKMREADESSEE